VKAGYRCRIEVELTGSTETNCFFTSPAIATAQINGAGFVELMALVDNPSVAGDWKVVDVEEVLNGTVGGNGANTNTITYQFNRRKKMCQFSAYQTAMTAVASQNSILNASAYPVRFRPTLQQDNAWACRNNTTNWQTAFIQIRDTGVFVVVIPAAANFTGSCAISAQGAVATSTSYLL
jgi:hypothetical protein